MTIIVSYYDKHGVLQVLFVPKTLADKLGLVDGQEVSLQLAHYIMKNI